jgi:UDP-N-acetylmuramate--alanine ligase
VVEADESDGTVALYEAEYAVITNVEMDHVDYFETEADLDLCFAAFAAQARRAVVYHGEDAGAQRAVHQARARAIPYGLGAGPGWRAEGVASAPGTITATLRHEGKEQGRLHLPVPGVTNLLNAMAVVAVLVDRGLPFQAVAESLSSFRSVRRRFEVVAQGRDLTVISDYAHHPTEIAACMQQVRGWGARRVIVVFQAHRYSRTAALGPAFPPAFTGADEVILTPVYAAAEQPVPGGELADLARHFQRYGKIPVTQAQSLLEAWELIRQKWRAGDVVLVAGAGDVEMIARWAAAELQPSSL